MQMIFRSFSIVLLCMFATNLHAQQATTSTKEKSGFFQLSIGFNFGRNTPNNPFNSFFIEENNRGYQIGLQYGRLFTPRFQMGLGVHYASYQYNRAERTFGPSLTARLRLNRPEQKFGFFAQAETAYELPIGNSDQRISEREGGLAIHPSLGVELSRTDGILGSLSLDVGYRFLQTAYQVNQFGNTEFRQPSYRRLVFRLAYAL